MVRNIKTKCKNVESKLLCNGSSFYFRLVGTRIEMLRQMIRNDKKKSIEKGIGNYSVQVSKVTERERNTGQLQLKARYGMEHIKHPFNKVILLHSLWAVFLLRGISRERRTQRTVSLSMYRVVYF